MGCIGLSYIARRSAHGCHVEDVVATIVHRRKFFGQTKIEYFDAICGTKVPDKSSVRDLCTWNHAKTREAGR